MKRDHLLGFPPVLLALDPEPRKGPGQTPVRAPMSSAKQKARRDFDRNETAKLSPAPVLSVADGFTYYCRKAQGKSFNCYRHDGKSLKPDVWNSTSGKWQKSNNLMTRLLAPGFLQVVQLDSKPKGVD